MRLCETPCIPAFLYSLNHWLRLAFVRRGRVPCYEFARLHGVLRKSPLAPDARSLLSTRSPGLLDPRQADFGPVCLAVAQAIDDADSCCSGRLAGRRCQAGDQALEFRVAAQRLEVRVSRQAGALAPARLDCPLD